MHSVFRNPNIFVPEEITTMTGTTADTTSVLASPQLNSSHDEEVERECNLPGRVYSNGEGSFDTACSLENAHDATAEFSATRFAAPSRPPLIEYTAMQQQHEGRQVVLYATTPRKGGVGAPAVAEANHVLSDEEMDAIIHQVDSLAGDMQSFVPVGDGAASAQFVADIVLGTMREHDSVEIIQAHCLRAICSLCKGRDRDGTGDSTSTIHSRSSGSLQSHGSGNHIQQHNQAAIMRAGGGEFVVETMARFSDSAVIQEQGCGAIWSLAVNASSRVDLTRAGACLRIYKALADFSSIESLAKTAIGAMRTLTPQLEAREAFKTLNTSKLTVQAMVTHPLCVPMQRDGCALLSNLAVNIEQQFVAVVPREELEAVVNTMANHREVPSVIQAACFALKNYSHEDRNCRTLRHCRNSLDLLVHASVFRQASLTCQADAADVLERLELINTLDESREDQAIGKFQQDLTDIREESLSSSTSTLEAETRHRQIKATFEFLRSHCDWSPRLVATGLMSLRQLLSSSGSMEFHADDIATVVQYCQRWKDNESVCVEACGLVSGLAQDSARHSAILKLGFMDFIFEALGSFKEDGKLVRFVLEALKMLSQNSEECVDLVKQELPTLMEAISMHGGNEAVQLHGVELVSLAF
jgi:hypothetical protein